MTYTKNYLEKLNKLLDSVEVTSDSNSSELDPAVNTIVSKLKEIKNSGGRVFFIGNGASAAISSHHSADFSKTAGIPSMCFSDPALLTCLSNDFGYENAFAKAIELYSKEGDVLFAISSSGKSENILNAVETAKKKGITVITLSGFENNNPLKNMGSINFYVPAKTYGLIEIVHTAICHLILDALMQSVL